jgi:hypothetical protein
VSQIGESAWFEKSAKEKAIELAHMCSLKQNGFKS